MEISCRVYKPRRARESPLYRLVEQHLEEFLRVYEERFARVHGRLRPVVERVLRAFLTCGLVERGFARAWCGTCRLSYLIPYSCRGRSFCPSCEKKRSILWAEWLREDVLEPVPHRHVVFTMPRLLRGIFRKRRELLLDLLLVGDLAREHFGVRILPAVGSRARLAHGFAELGEFAQGIAIGREAVSLAEAADHPDSLILGNLCLGLLFVRKGEFEEAIALLDEAQILCTKWSLEIWFPAVAAPLGSAYTRVGRLGEAVALLERAVEQATSMRVMFGYAALVGALAEAYLLAGRIEEGRATASRGLQFALAHEERGHEAWALRLLGEIAAAARSGETEPESAESLYQKGAMLAQELGNLQSQNPFVNLRDCYDIGDASAGVQGEVR